MSSKFQTKVGAFRTLIKTQSALYSAQLRPLANRLQNLFPEEIHHVVTHFTRPAGGGFEPGFIVLMDSSTTAHQATNLSSKLFRYISRYIPEAAIDTHIDMEGYNDQFVLAIEIKWDIDKLRKDGRS